ncbi:TOM1-like protein 1 [Linum perenne]
MKFLQDDLTTTLVQQCRQSQSTIQRIIETEGDNEAVLFEALNVNDEIQKALSKYEEMEKPLPVVPCEPQPAMIVDAIESPNQSKEEEDALIRKPAGTRAGTRNGEGGSNEDMMDDLDEMIFGKKGGDTSVDDEHDTKKKKKQEPSSKDDLISL